MPVHCGACDYYFNDSENYDDLPDCPKCGFSVKTTFPLGQVGRLQGATCIKSIPPKGGRWISKSESKHSHFKRDDEQHYIERVIDRGNNYYYERIINKETGEVVREVEELLTEHQGRGSAKIKRKPNKGFQVGQITVGFLFVPHLF